MVEVTGLWKQAPIYLGSPNAYVGLLATELLGLLSRYPVQNGPVHYYARDLRGECCCSAASPLGTMRRKWLDGPNPVCIRSNMPVSASSGLR